MPIEDLIKLSTLQWRLRVFERWAFTPEEIVLENEERTRWLAFSRQCYALESRE
jgi:hypothetical protein